MEIKQVGNILLGLAGLMYLIEFAYVFPYTKWILAIGLIIFGFAEYVE